MYQAVVTTLRETQALVDRLHAEVETQIEQRRAAERASRDRASAAIEALADLHRLSVPLAILGETVHSA